MHDEGASPPVPQPAEDTKAGPAGHVIGYAGRLGRLFRIFVVNLLLQIVTLGVYRFWARTRIRRYVWGSTRVNDEPFEYTGTGRELFVGFMRVLIVLFPLLLVLAIVELYLDEDQFVTARSLDVVKSLGFLYLIYAGGYFARRYRMSRTLWHGIRFRQGGSAWAYAGRALGWVSLAIATLGLTLPFYHLALARYEHGNLRFGSAAFAFDGSVRALYPTFAVAYFGGLVLTALAAAALAPLALPGLRSIPRLDWLELWHAVAIAAVAAAPICFTATFMWYRARFWRFVARATRLDTVRFDLPAITGLRLFRLTFGNYLIGLLSLGLLAPIVIQRSMRFWTRHLQLDGTLDLAHVAQTESGPLRGEGLAGFFDIDVG